MNFNLRDFIDNLIYDINVMYEELKKRNDNEELYFSSRQVDFFSDDDVNPEYGVEFDCFKNIYDELQRKAKFKNNISDILLNEYFIKMNDLNDNNIIYTDYEYLTKKGNQVDLSILFEPWFEEEVDVYCHILHNSTFFPYERYVNQSTKKLVKYRIHLDSIYEKFEFKIIRKEVVPLVAEIEVNRNLYANEMIEQCISTLGNEVFFENIFKLLCSILMKEEVNAELRNNNKIPCLLSKLYSNINAKYSKCEYSTKWKHIVGRIGMKEVIDEIMKYRNITSKSKSIEDEQVSNKSKSSSELNADDICSKTYQLSILNSVCTLIILNDEMRELLSESVN